MMCGAVTPPVIWAFSDNTSVLLVSPLAVTWPRTLPSMRSPPEKGDISLDLGLGPDQGIDSVARLFGLVFLHGIQHGSVLSFHLLPETAGDASPAPGCYRV